MFAVQRIATNAPKLMSPVTQQVRNEYIIATKPRNRISFPEKIVHGLFLSSVVLATPIYVSLHIESYKAKK